MQIKHLPVTNEEAEQSVLGGLMLKNDSWDIIIDIVTEDDFYYLKHKLIFKTIMHLLAQDHPVDWLTLSVELKKNGEFDNAGGDIYLVDLMRNTPSTASIKHYASMVKQASEDRRLVSAAHTIIDLVHTQTPERVDKAQQAVLEIAEQKASEPLLPTEYMPEVYSDFIDRSNGEEVAHGISSGYPALDDMTLGMRPGELLILAARPSMGKTLLAMNIAEHVAFNKKTVLMVSLEMTKKSIGKRLLTSVSGLPAHKINTGKISHDEIPLTTEAYRKISECKLLIDDAPVQTVMDIRAKARRIKRKHGLDLIVIDYLQLIKATEGENETIKLGYISRGLKALSKDLNVPVLALCQLNREIEKRQNRRPVMSDIRQSGAIEQDADIIMFIDRPETYDESAEKELAYIHIVKNREGKIGDVPLTFKGDYCRFENYTGKPRVITFDPNKFRKDFDY